MVNLIFPFFNLLLKINLEFGDKISVWRVIDTDLANPYFVTAADEALAVSCGKFDAKPTLHFYRRKTPAISVGYFRKVHEDVEIEKCNELGIKIVRRGSGGGSIYTDENQLIFGLITKSRIGSDVEDSFEIICNCLTDALNKINIHAKFKPPNDILINGKKISGSAQVKKRKAYIHHSTIILASDENIINQVLINHKTGYTTSIKHEFGWIPDITILKKSIISAFQDKFNVELKMGEFSKLEKSLIQDLLANKYTTNSWNFKR